MSRPPTAPHRRSVPARPLRAGTHVPEGTPAPSGLPPRRPLAGPAGWLWIPLLLLGACGGDAADPVDASGPEGAGPGELGLDGTADPERPRDRWGIPLDAPVDEEARDAIGHLILQFRPLDPTLTSNHHDRQIMQQRERFQRVLEGGERFGNAALQAFTGAADEPYAVRRALLWVGGKAAPESASDLLATLYTTYGFPIEDRTEAALVLAETSPERFLSLTRSWLERTEPKRKTMPDDEFLVDGWATACLLTGQSAVPLLADVATNLYIDPPARWLAIERMTEFEPEPIGLRALETCLVESTGDGILRRKSAQSLRELLPRESACSLMLEVLQREVDLNFRDFLRDMIQDNCRDVLLGVEGLDGDPSLEEQAQGRQDPAPPGTGGTGGTADGSGGR